MSTNSSKKSLVQILIDRPDTGFEGRRLEDSRVEEDQQSEFVDVYHIYI